MSTPEKTSSPWLKVWLLTLASLVLSIVAVGGLTRLTGSGLSMVDWRLIMGAIPPLTEADWLAVFEQYKAFPQYQKVNFGMSLDEFKTIFLWEYTHRLMGRLLGVVFLVPFCLFLIKKAIPPRTTKAVLIAFLLGGCQGLLGWYMVKSGLVQEPRVSPYRLAAHLSLALVILSFLVWVIMDHFHIDRFRKVQSSQAYRSLSVAMLVLVAVQVFYGALTAGLKAGYGFNTFPTMAGFWIPPNMDVMAPWFRNLFENPTTVQFLHRGLGWLVFVASWALFFWSRRAALTSGQRRMIRFFLYAVMLQFALGVATLLSAVQVGLASLHQMGACLVLLLAVANVYSSLPPRDHRDRSAQSKVPQTASSSVRTASAQV